MVTLARDPEAVVGAWRVEVVADGHRLEAWARGGAGAALKDRAAGQRVRVRGRVEPVQGVPWLAARHVAGRLVIDDVGEWEDGDPLSRLANAVRALVRRGAERLPREQRALLLGFVLGDGREQPPEVADDFDAAGLQHLLVVSGQNVAFVLAAIGPGLRRLGPRARLVATVAVLVVFATVTRFEPSVLRATAMAALAVLGASLGRPASGVRVLALAGTALLVADPFLIHSIAFRLSAAASAGILLLSGPLARAVPGPRFVVVPLAVTLAAQAAVAPVLVPIFGPMPVAAIPANLLAGPVAGLVMMWGCSAGLVAGVVGGPVAGLLQWPTGLGIAWVAGVARWGGALPLGQVGLLGVVVAVAGGAGLGLARARSRPGWALVCALVVVAALLAPAVGEVRRDPRPGVAEVSGGVVWRGAAGEGAGGRRAVVVVLDGDASAEYLLRDLREAGIGRVDLVVSRSGGSRAASTLAVLARRVSIDQVWAPSGHDIAGAVVPPVGVSAAGGVQVDVRAVTPRLEVDVAVLGASRPSAR
nr:ComEC/Rec2 family competence protein [Rhabdothermincola salaria]